MGLWKPSHDDGYVLILVAASLLLLMGAAAYAIDLSGIRLDRAADQRITDAAASAGALATYEGDAVDGCETALAYVAINTGGISTVDDSDCITIFDSSCPATARRLTVNTGRWDITVVHPVPATDALMNPGQLGASTYGTPGDDGDPCDRFGVQMTATRAAHFGRVLGADQGATTVHSVARAELPDPDGVPINVLVLDRFGCGTVKASGHGGIIVDAILNTDDNVLEPGQLAADSDAFNCAADPDPAVLVIEGNNAVVRADGPEGCDSQLSTEPVTATLNKGLGCGLIQILAPGTPGCNTPACAGSGSGPNNPVPEPTALPERLTRAPIDHRYNCRSDYSTVGADVSWAASALTTGNEQNIDGCTGGNDTIHDLIRAVSPSGTPSDHGPWETWQAHGYPCDIPSSHTAIIEGGNWVIDCTDFNVRTDVTITGRVVFDGNVAVTSSDGHLTIDNSGNTIGFAFLRSGRFSKDGQASITLNETMVYASKTSRVQMDGGSGGSLTWIAPNDPSETDPLDDLALWSDSEIPPPDTHFWAGQAGLTLEGVFFVPITTVEYAGQGSQEQEKAQFIADRLHARGQGELVVAPVFGRSVGFRPPPITILLR